MNDDVQATVARLRVQLDVSTTAAAKLHAKLNTVHVRSDDLTALLDALDAERAARVQAEEFRDEALRDGNEMLRELQKVATERDAAAANVAALRVAANASQECIALLSSMIRSGESFTAQSTLTARDTLDRLRVALAAPPSAAAVRVQRVVAAAEKITRHHPDCFKRYNTGDPEFAYQGGCICGLDGLRAALNGNEADR